MGNEGEVRCRCGMLFGIEQPNGTLAIKYRDLFRIVDGNVTGPCRKCGAKVEWPSKLSSTVVVNYRPFTYTCNCACSLCMSGSCCQTMYSSNMTTIHTRIT